jgi:hypothetical protein
VGAVASVLLTPLPAQSQLAPGFPLGIAATHFYFDADNLGVLVDGALAPDGRVCVADFREADIACLAPDKSRWTHIGRKGEGPGEFSAPYRLAFTPAGKMWVWDLQTQQLSLFDRAGHFAGRSPLPYRFRQVDNIVALGEDQIVFCGVTSLESPARDSAMHLFRWVKSATPLTAVRAFGPLPPVKLREKIEHWGAGAMTLTPRGTLYYVMRVPYALFEYSSHGELIRRIPPPVALSVGPDLGVNIQKTRTTETIGRTEALTVVYPLRAVEVGARWILTGRRTAHATGTATLDWDLLDIRTGNRITETPVNGEASEAAMVAYDPAIWTIWSMGTRGQDVGIWAVTLRAPSVAK